MRVGPWPLLDAGSADISGLYFISGFLFCWCCLVLLVCCLCLGVALVFNASALNLMVALYGTWGSECWVLNLELSVYTAHTQNTQLSSLLSLLLSLHLSLFLSLVLSLT